MSTTSARMHQETVNYSMSTTFAFTSTTELLTSDGHQAKEWGVTASIIEKEKFHSLQSHIETAFL